MAEVLNDEPDVPSIEDLQSPADARAWAEAADRKRPWRAQFRDIIAAQLKTLAPRSRVLELGSGPGFLAERVLGECANLSTYTLFDFSEPMLEMSRARVGRFACADFVLGDFSSDAWTKTLPGSYDCAVTVQAVHEVRHKRHVPRLYRQIHEILTVSGTFLSCDHIPRDDSWRSTALFMTEDEQFTALASAGFADIHIVGSIKGLVLYQCRKPG